jgi:glucokinase
MTHYSMAIDIGGTNTKIAVVSKDGSFLKESILPTLEYTSFNDYTDKIAAEIKAAQQEYPILGVGVGCPNYNNQSERIENPPNLPWGTVEIKKILQSKSSLPIAVEKDAPLAALGEYYFGNHATDNLAVITVGTGIGSGFIINQKLHHTPHGYGSEAGHLIVGANSIPCGCGGMDHLEAYASVSALRKKASEVFGKKVSFTELTELVAKHDAKAIKILKEAAYYLAVGITQVVNIVGSKKVVLAGGGILLGPKLFDEINEQYKKLCFKTHEYVTVAPSSLPVNHGALLGAAALIFRDNF